MKDIKKLLKTAVTKVAKTTTVNLEGAERMNRLAEEAKRTAKIEKAGKA